MSFTLQELEPESGLTDVSQAGMVKVDVQVAPSFNSTQSSSQTSNTSTSGLVGTSASQNISIPSWVKNNAKWWSQGQVDDSQFEKGIQYLIQNGIMKVPPTSVSSSEPSAIPSWVKNNAGWWANGQISDSEFVKGIQYMISNGMITVSS